MVFNLMMDFSEVDCMLVACVRFEQISRQSGLVLPIMHDQRSVIIYLVNKEAHIPSR